MLKTRIIPTLLWKNFGLVKGEGFDSWRRVGTVLPAIKVYNTRDVDELILVDICATQEGREPDYESIAEFSCECFIPLTIGGGIQNLDHITRLLHTGADKITINTAAYTNPSLIYEAANRFGSQCVVVSIDVRRTPAGGYECYSHSGSSPTGRDPISWARQVELLGAGEILLTSVERDGTMRGYDLEVVAAVSSAVRIPVIASGGAGNYAHMADVITSGASAIAAASIFHFTEQTPLAAKHFLRTHGVHVRPEYHPSAGSSPAPSLPPLNLQSA
ncbi:MAG: imidazole glycerol phosphate synthase subunit HisF [Verrucomicrobia bacterium]|nr:imidazole glycerol phosphate synthase subunit HisF [Verrucomicrobiota bacterium]